MLNSSQQNAVDSKAQSLLIVAGPGTGKTHTLTHRILSFSKEFSDNNQRLLAITFTHKAADEMRQRIANHDESILEKVFVGTFHQWCLDVLRTYSYEPLKIFSPDECVVIAGEIWPDASRSDCKKRLSEISFWKSTQFRAEPSDDARMYQDALEERGGYDFDDILLKTLCLLENDHQALTALRVHYTHIFVDEYQDINSVQQELLRVMVGDDGAITAIGDPDQAIYGFRGSDVSFFHAFEMTFPNTQVIFLNENYRSAQTLLSAADQVIASARDAKVPQKIARIYEQGLFTVHQAATDKAEAEFIVHTIEKLLGGTSMFSQDSGRVDSDTDAALGFGDIAVCVRLKAQMNVVVKALERSGMPYHIVGKAEDVQEISDDMFSQRDILQDVDKESISVMTLHASKGLEFACVFISGCEQGLLPLDIFDMVCDSHEERRLVYVGMTRAKHRLYLSYANKRFLYGKRLQLKPSVFLNEIDDALKTYSQSKAYKKTPPPKDDEQLTLF